MKIQRLSSVAAVILAAFSISALAQDKAAEAPAMTAVEKEAAKKNGGHIAKCGRLCNQIQTPTEDWL